jgi:5-methylcytosine-specific restriction endonuclease McrA
VRSLPPKPAAATKVCESCTLALPLVNFYPHKKGGHSALCRRCTVDDNRLRRENPVEHARITAARRACRATAKARRSAEVTEKACTKCGDVQPLKAFRVHRGLYGRSSWCPECERQDALRYQEENRTEINAKKRAAWAVPERSETEKSASRSRASNWYEQHKERHAQTYRRYQIENAAVLGAYGKRRRELAVSSDFSFDDWLTTLAAFNHCCAYCLRGDRPLTMDHMNPISRGGLHTADNIIPACRSCNSKKGDRSILLMASKG